MISLQRVELISLWETQKHPYSKVWFRYVMLLQGHQHQTFRHLKKINSNKTRKNKLECGWKYKKNLRSLERSACSEPTNSNWAPWKGMDLCVSPRSKDDESKDS